MNQLLDRILDRIKLTDIIDIIGILSITLSAVVATAESVSLNLPAWVTFFVLLAIVFLRGVETWLKRRLASEPSPEQEQLIRRLRAENESLRSVQSRETIPLRPQFPMTETGQDE
jgi:hypothetical protein